MPSWFAPRLYHEKLPASGYYVSRRIFDGTDYYIRFSARLFDRISTRGAYLLELVDTCLCFRPFDLVLSFFTGNSGHSVNHLALVSVLSISDISRLTTVPKSHTQRHFRIQRRHCYKITDFLTLATRCQQPRWYDARASRSAECQNVVLTGTSDDGFPKFRLYLHFPRQLKIPTVSPQSPRLTVTNVRLP